MKTEEKEVHLFVCGHNSGRSQMAEVYFNFYNKDKNKMAISAGTGIKGDGKINPKVIDLLKSKGIDILNQPKKYYPKMLAENMINCADKIYTMGCMNGECTIGNKKIEFDFALDDPANAGTDIENMWNNFEGKMKGVI
ncbi:MAG: low molecular weight phosphatase family protein [Candidatus Gracilibacteria bacterium]|nr:low molecular weight phosphatase family protein [Candidatus Gracilibacteria bacterium]